MNFSVGSKPSLPRSVYKVNWWCRCHRQRRLWQWNWWQLFPLQSASNTSTSQLSLSNLFFTMIITEKTMTKKITITLTMTSCIPWKRPHDPCQICQQAKSITSVIRSPVVKTVPFKIMPHATREWFSDDNSNDGDDVDDERDEFGQTLIRLPQLATNRSSNLGRTHRTAHAITYYTTRKQPILQKRT